MSRLIYPSFAKDRGPLYWLRPSNLAASRNTFFRMDYSNEWRQTFDERYRLFGADAAIDRSVSFERLLGRSLDDGFRFVILGDTGEGDKSQYGLNPLLRAVNPDFMIINGDIAYPAGRMSGEGKNDYLHGFFEPYRNFHCPIWAVPGNHEYYSDLNGEEFWQVFCSRTCAGLWDEYGLRLVPQPGSYWEMRDRTGQSKLVVIGLDSGKKANLDGDNDWWQFWKRKISPDGAQHTWFESRLRRAQDAGDSVIVLFHIPALVREKHEEKYLNTLHRILASYSCVRLVVCGHEHNYQSYTPDMFQRYLREKQLRGSINNPDPPHYIVAGSSGAALASTTFGDEYKTEVRFPSPSDYQKYVNALTRNTSFLQKWAVAKIGSAIEDHAHDNDDPYFLTFLLVEVGPQAAGPWKAKITPVFLRNVAELFSAHPDDFPVDVQTTVAPTNTPGFAECFQHHLSITL